MVILPLSVGINTVRNLPHVILNMRSLYSIPKIHIIITIMEIHLGILKVHGQDQNTLIKIITDTIDCHITNM